jgi:hypothetical protein
MILFLLQASAQNARPTPGESPRSVLYEAPHRAQPMRPAAADAGRDRARCARHRDDAGAPGVRSIRQKSVRGLSLRGSLKRSRHSHGSCPPPQIDCNSQVRPNVLSIMICRQAVRTEMTGVINPGAGEQAPRDPRILHPCWRARPRRCWGRSLLPASAWDSKKSTKAYGSTASYATIAASSIRSKNLATSRQPVRAEVATHVLRMERHLSGPDT